MVPSAAQIYEHVRVLFVIADPLDEAASADRVAFEGGEIDRSGILHLRSRVVAAAERPLFGGRTDFLQPA